MNKKLKNEIQEQGLEKGGRFYGLYQGIVIDNQDLEKRGRLKIKVPSVFGNQIFEDWIYGKSIFNGNDIGIWSIPSKNSGVWISFINGDPKMPIWEMGWFSDKEIPKEFKERYLDGISLKNDRIFIQSKEASIELFENGKIDIISKADISINSNGGKIEIKNGSQNLNSLLNELKSIVLGLKVTMGGSPISDNLLPDTVTRLKSWGIKVSKLLK
ncbi:phage baseplate assembly protein V [Bernardetia sp. ABR2-2B]|uniref:phage baseplate assembly protein V n=1 Tax=Bernardetia sp. ABR2-2B TaxID=3127472 RepID=UPI0030CBFF98